MCPLAWPAVVSAAALVGVVTVLGALLLAESEEQLAAVKALAPASRKTKMRFIEKKKMA